LLMILEAQGITLAAQKPLNVYVVSLGEATNIEALQIVQSIRQAGFSAERDVMNRKAKAQFKTADKLNAQLVLTIGETELANGVVNVKNLATRVEKAYPLTQIQTQFETVYQEMMHTEKE
ncbi:MAG TPA: His/Gly/Thr/Pro-type tRNA ligase C-terminal domain-containing protein, partial [Enterococcus sp.]|nr:His/Gly/Thr/Pro-type tRNA ligase C-terminal domain-containing protein [Enterococcus sp.]